MLIKPRNNARVRVVQLLCCQTRPVAEEKQNLVDGQCDCVVSNRWQIFINSLIMLFMTWIARVGDGLPLAASIPEDEEVCLRLQSFVW